MVCPFAPLELLPMPGNGAPAVETFAGTNAHKAGCQFTLRVPMPKGRHKFLKVHRAAWIVAKKRKVFMIGDRHCGRLAYPVVFTTRLPRAPFRLVVTHSIAQGNR